MKPRIENLKALFTTETLWPVFDPKGIGLINSDKGEKIEEWATVLAIVVSKIPGVYERLMANRGNIYVPYPDA